MESLKKLMAAASDKALQSTFREAAREDMGTHTAAIAEQQEQRTAKCAELS